MRSPKKPVTKDRKRGKCLGYGATDEIYARSPHLCTPQPRFRCRDPLWPSSVRIIHNSHSTVSGFLLANRWPARGQMCGNNLRTDNTRMQRTMQTHFMQTDLQSDRMQKHNLCLKQMFEPLLCRQTTCTRAFDLLQPICMQTDGWGCSLLVEHRTVTPLRRVLLPGAARDFSLSQLSVQTLLRVSVHPRVQSHVLTTSVRTLKIP